MAIYIVCKNCRSIVEYNPEKNYSGGISYISFKCPKCGYEKRDNVNHTHYGNDGIE